MTTIVYKDGVMACDSLITTGDDRAIAGVDCYKVFKLHNGALMGISGSANDCYLTDKFFTAITDYHSLLDAIKGTDECTEAHFLVVFPDAPELAYRVEVGEDGAVNSFVVTVLDGCAVGVGSGSKYAEVAAYCGMSAKEATEVAAEFDIYSGGTIRSYKLGKAK